MSMSKIAPNCAFCKIGKGIYCCPRCNIKYCSSVCYKSRGHTECSESFFKEWIEKSLQEKSCNNAEKENMLRMLKKFEEEYDEDPSELSIEDRFAGLNINNADESTIWQNLNDEEKEKFKAFIRDESNLATILPVNQPWWTNATLNLVTEESENADLGDGLGTRPPYPLNIKKLSELTSAKPSNCIQYNLVNVLYSYTFLYRFYNCDLRDFIEDVVDFIFRLSPVLSKGHNYFSLEEVVQDSIRLICASEFDTHLTFVKSIVNDLELLMKGPNNAKPATFVLCALHDIKLLFLELKHANRENKVIDKTVQKMLFQGVKKIEYFMSWCLDFENTLSEIASDLVILMLPELIPHAEKNESAMNICENSVKPHIEELD
ncbi:zinc finger HIT domain-containing protein 2 [Caerostris extrusa]|uniref:Zinc finger HIT domain-containing protein 2 n=1 Tax=Caerostris extrusa TaxID=172846 RepID=A0AAV4MS33_CAEEX|nr:zinc finger HIT domain-containing protein 2 [Caerostris extrusa]